MDQFTPAALSEISARMEREGSATIIRWAVDTFPHLCLTASMTDAVLIDLAVRVEPTIEVVFIDTGYHFPETLETVDRVRHRYCLNLRVMTAAQEDSDMLTMSESGGCCSAAKVHQLDRALAGKEAWMSGLRRCEAPTRTNTPIVTRDPRGLVKINPIATWSDLDVRRYIIDHDVLVNPLIAHGYASIGCWPCTKPVEAGADPRSGRWAGTDKTECGLHV
jgi:phosphoadenosine phosphosulfate reductase